VDRAVDADRTIGHDLDDLLAVTEDDARGELAGRATLWRVRRPHHHDVRSRLVGREVGADTETVARAVVVVLVVRLDRLLMPRPRRLHRQEVEGRLGHDREAPRTGCEPPPERGRGKL